MSDERVTAKQFHEAEGVEEWRVLFTGASAHWRTASLAEGAAFAAEIADAATAAGRAPDIDLRPRDVVVTTRRPDGQLDEADVALAQRVSAIARRSGLVPDPSVLQAMLIAVAHAEAVDVRPFFNAALGYDDFDATDSVEPNRRAPAVVFHPFDKVGRGRTHIDVSVPAEHAQARVQAALAAGGRMADESYAPQWWTLASPHNHGVDVAIWTDTEG